MSVWSMCSPFFTYWVTFVQIVCFIVSVAVFGFATVGGAMTTISGEVDVLHLPSVTDLCLPEMRRSK